MKICKKFFRHSYLITGNLDSWVEVSEEEFQSETSIDHNMYKREYDFSDRFCTVQFFRHKENSYYDWKVCYQKEA
jgi:hypothetical protein